MNNLIPDLEGKAAEKAIESIDRHILEPTDNVVRPSSESIGKSIGKIVDGFFAQKRFFAEARNIACEKALERFKEMLEQKYRDIPFDKLIEPDIHVLLQTLEDSQYCVYDENLAKMFADLIVGTMNSDKKDNAHPAFFTIIRQMSSIDAKLIKTFKKQHVQRIIKERKIENSSFPKFNKIKTFKPLFDCDGISDSQILASLNNLVRLGLVEIDYPRSISEEIKKTIEENEQRERLIARGVSVSITKDNYTDMRLVSLTELGKEFLKICCQDES